MPIRIICSSHFFNEERIMNKDQVKGKAKEIGGKIQEETGELVGSSKQQVKGVAKQVEGKLQKQRGDLREAIDDATDELIDRGNRQ